MNENECSDKEARFLKRNEKYQLALRGWFKAFWALSISCVYMFICWCMALLFSDNLIAVLSVGCLVSGAASIFCLWIASYYRSQSRRVSEELNTLTHDTEAEPGETKG